MKKIILVFMFLLIPQPVLAGVISLTTTISTDIMTENVTRVSVKLLNSGDESAHNVQISLLTENFQSDPIFVGDLSPNNPFEGDSTLSLIREISPGNYPLVVLSWLIMPMLTVIHFLPFHRLLSFTRLRLCQRYLVSWEN